MNASAAQSAARKAQVAGAVLLCAAAALAVIPFGGGASGAVVETAGPAGPKGPGVAKGEPGGGTPTDAAALAALFADVGPAMGREQPPPPPDAPPAVASGVTAEVPQPEVGPEVRYIGGIFSGKFRRAIVAVAEGQQSLRIGETITQTGAQVAEIAPNYIVLRENGKDRVVELARRVARAAPPINPALAAQQAAMQAAQANAAALLSMEGQRYTADEILSMAKERAENMDPKQRDAVMRAAQERANAVMLGAAPPEKLPRSAVLRAKILAAGREPTLQELDEINHLLKEERVRAEEQGEPGEEGGE